MEKIKSALVKQVIIDEEQWGIKNLKKYKNFSKRVVNIKKKLKLILENTKSMGYEIGGYCAPAKGNTLLNYLEINETLISYIADNNTLKQSKFTPGSHIPIISDEEYLKNNPRYSLLLAWNYLEYFVENSKYFNNGGKFIVPLPKPRIISK